MRSVICSCICILVLFSCCAEVSGQSQPTLTPTLSVVSVTPLSEGVISVSGVVPLTVVFNRAVIALGSDFGPGKIPSSLEPLLFSLPLPGRWRWVTTSVARFDPNGTWPTDLSLTASLNPGLRSYDNLALSDSTNWKAKLETPPLTFFGVTVTSPQAAALTDGLWTPSLPYSFDSINEIQGDFWELPPDAKLILSFSDAIDPSLIKLGIELMGPNKQSFTSLLVFNPCEGGSCLNLTLSSPLGISTGYTLVIRAGTKYNTFAGPLQQPLYLQLYGLLDFRFSFHTPEEFTDLRWGRPRFTHHNLFLRHGLSPSTALSDLRKSITITPSLPFEITQISKSGIQLFAQFQPSTTYQIQVFENPKVLDGFGLPLKNSSTKFQTDDLTSFQVRPSFSAPGVVFEDDFKEDWVYLVRNGTNCQGKLTITAQSFQAADSATALCGFNSMNCGNTLKRGTAYEVDCSQNDNIKLKQTLLTETGSMVVQELANVFLVPNTYYVVKTDLAVSTLFSGNQLFVWVTLMSTNQKVAGAKIILQFASTSSSITTDSDGLAIFPIQTSGTATLVIERNGRVFIFPNPFYLSYSRSDPYTTFTGVTMTDREIYKPGDAVYVKGYIKSANPSETNLPDLTMSIYFETQQGSVPFNQPILYDNKSLGTFSFTFQIPTNVNYKDYSYSVTSFGNTVSLYKMITVSDPRIPALNLDLSIAEKVYKPASGVNLNLAATYYFGSPLIGYPIKISWKITPAPNAPRWSSYNGYNLNSLFSSVAGLDWMKFPFPNPAAVSTLQNGEFNLTTDNNGQISYPFKVPVDINEGDTITIQGQLFAPSGEMIQKSASIRVSQSEWRVVVSSTNANPLPGYSVSFKVDLQDQNMVSIPNKQISGRIYRWNPNQKLNTDDLLSGRIPEMNKVLLSECKFQSNQGRFPVCPFQIPSTGKFLAVFSCQDPSGVVVGTSYPFGKTDDEWKTYPLRSLEGLSVDLEKNQYQQGELVKLSFLNPFMSSKMAVFWGQNTVKYQIFDLNNGNDTSSINQVSFTIGPECQDTCSIFVVVHSPRQPANYAPPITVPTSPLFDWFAPSSFTYYTSVGIIQPQAGLSLQILNDAVASPGDNVSVTIKLFDNKNNPKDGEVAVFIVDQSVLDLKPPPESNLSDSLKPPSNSLYLNILSSHQQLSSGSAYRESLKIVQRRLQIDPYISPSYWAILKSWQTGVEIPDDLFFAQNSYFLTWGSFPIFTTTTTGVIDEKTADGAPMPPSFVNNLSPGKTAASSGETPTVRSQFLTTPYWNPVLITKNGQVSFSFKLPDNVGKFSIRAFAISQKDYSNGQGSFISRKKVATLVGIAPRMVRYGDKFEAGVTLSVLDLNWQGTLTVEVSYECGPIVLMVKDGVSSELRQKATVQILPGSQILPTKFTFLATKVGTAVLNFTLRQQDGAPLDALQLTFPILGIQESVFVATSMALSEKSSDPLVNEGIQLPPYVPGTGNLSLEVGVGKLPSVGLFSSYLLKFDPETPSALDLLVALVPQFALGRYKNPSIYGQAMFDAQFTNKLASSLLKSYQTSVGLKWTKDSYNYIDPYLNAFALLVDKIIRTLGGDGLDASLKASAQISVQSWMTNSLSNPRTYYPDLNLMAMIGFATNQLPDSVYSLLMSNYTQMSSSGKLYFALFLKSKTGGSALSQSLITEAQNNVRVNGRTAYVGVGTSTNDADFISTCWLVFELSSSNPTNPIVEKMANFISQFGRKADSPFNYNPFLGKQSSCVGLFSMVVYDISRSNTQPNLNITVATGSQYLMQVQFVNDMIYTRKSFSFDSLLPRDQVKFLTTGQGEASVVLGLDFVPSELFNASVNRGIEVKKVIQLLGPDGTPTGGPVTKLTPGTQVLVTIQVDLSSSVSFLQIVDPLPGCLEAIDTNGAVTPCSWYNSLNTRDVGRPGGPGIISNSKFGPCSWSFYFPYLTREVRADQVRFYGYSLSSGSHVASYKAVVVTPGLFVIPPAKAFDVANPEIMGLSSSGNFTSTTLQVSNLIPVTNCVKQLPTTSTPSARPTPTIPLTLSPTPFSQASSPSLVSAMVVAITMMVMMMM